MTATMQKQAPYSANGTAEKKEEEKKSPTGMMKDFKNHADAIMGYANQYVVNQPELSKATTIAFLTGLKIYIPGGPGLGKTLLGKTIADYLKMSQAYTCLNPDETPANILGKRRLDLKTHEEVFDKGIFLKGDVVILDELNRSSDKAQAAMIEPLNSGTVTINGKTRRVSQIMTVLAMGNLEEDGGTRPIMSAIWDRFDCVVMAKELTEDSALLAVDRYLNPLDTSDPTHIFKEETPQSMRKILSEYRHLVQTLRKGVKHPVRETAAYIAAAFHDPKEWRIRTSYRTVESLVDTALAMSLVESAVLPSCDHVWEAAHWCLGGLEPREEHFYTAERLKYISQAIKECKKTSPARLLDDKEED